MKYTRTQKRSLLSAYRKEIKLIKKHIDGGCVEWEYDYRSCSLCIFDDKFGSDGLCSACPINHCGDYRPTRGSKLTFSQIKDGDYPEGNTHPVHVRRAWWIRTLTDFQQRAADLAKELDS